MLRTRHPDLEREAAERAFEARQQVGLNVHPEDPELDKIRHPSQAQLEARLGPAWKLMGVGEVAGWLYQWRDPIKGLVDATNVAGEKVGLLNSPVHRAVLLDSSYMYWGAGLYDELPPGEPEIERRYYGIVLVAKKVPVVTTPPAFTDIATSEFKGDIEYLKKRGIVFGIPNKGPDGKPDGTFRYEPKANVTREQMAAYVARAMRELS